MKRIFFVDYENVSHYGLEGIENLTTNDEVYLFHYVGVGEVKYEILMKLAASDAKTQIIKLTSHEKNAMDFQIVAMLGVLTGKYTSKAQYIIVSNDKGYASAAECIRNIIPAKLSIERQPSISGLSKNHGVETELKSALTGIVSVKNINKVIKVFEENISLQDFYVALQHILPNDCGRIYKIVKPIYKRQEVAQ